MSTTPTEQNEALTIADLYPNSNVKEQAEIEYRLEEYLRIVIGIFERICIEEPDILTDLDRRATLRRRTHPRES